MSEEATHVRERKTGEGVDRTQIRQLLELTPEERLRKLVVEVRNVTAFLAAARRRNG
jgi:hypothetical protein